MKEISSYSYIHISGAKVNLTRYALNAVEQQANQKTVLRKMWMLNSVFDLSGDLANTGMYPLTILEGFMLATTCMICLIMIEKAQNH